MQPEEKVLIVDDSYPNLEIISSMLAGDYIVETAANGEESLEKAKWFRPGIVLLDIMMPGIDGYEVCRRMRKDLNLTSTKIILVSAKQTVDDRLVGYDSGADDFIKKPFDKNELLAKTKVFSRLNEEEQKTKRLNRILLSRQQDIPNVLWECDTDLNLTYIDDNIASLLGFDPDEVIQTPIVNLLHKGQQEFGNVLRSKLASETPSIRGTSFSFQKKTGDPITLQIFADAVYQDDGRLMGMGGIFRDMNDFVQLLEYDSSQTDQPEIWIDPELKIHLPLKTDQLNYPFATNLTDSTDIREFLCDQGCINLLQFAFDQSEDVPFPVEIEIPDDQGISHPFTVELKFKAEGPSLEGKLFPSSAKDQLGLVSKRIENQSQRIKDQEESLKNAIVMDSDTKQHILQDARNLSSEILDLVKALSGFAFPSDGIFNLEEYKHFISNRNLQIYTENLRLLGNKIHGLKGSCGFLIPVAKTLCHRMEEITRPLADLELIVTHMIRDLLKQFVFKIEELLDLVDLDDNADQNIDDWLKLIDRTLQTSFDFLGNNAHQVSSLIRERSTDNGEIRARRKEEYVSVSLEGYEELAEKVKELYYELSGSLKDDQKIQAGALFNQFLSTHQDIKKVPLVLTRYERLVPKLAKDYGKEAEFQFINHNVKADREFWDSIHEILNHMLKNAVIHGIEAVQKRKELQKTPSGNISVELKEDALHILLTISDDGKGIDSKEIAKKALEKGLVTTSQIDSMTESEIFELIFHQGVSTAEQLDDNAGRGVGMNAVKEVMMSLQGTCTIESHPGKGSQWHFSFLKNNVSLPCIIITIGDLALAIPEDYVETFLDYKDSERTTIKQSPAYKYNGSLIPLLNSQALFQKDGIKEDLKNRSVIVLKNNEDRKGMVINQIIHHAVQPILPLPKIYRNVPIYQGITIHNNDPIQVVNIEKMF